MQTACPAKVLSWSSSDNTVRIEPQFIETWADSAGLTHYEDVPDGDAYVDNVPVCYPWHMTWDITVGAFGLVICTKYSLDLWRQQLQRIDPGDLRRFTMSGATFHPVVIGESPNATQQFVALSNLVLDELNALKDKYNVHTHGSPQAPSGNLITSVPSSTPAGAPPDFQYTPSSVASATVKVSE